MKMKKSTGEGSMRKKSAEKEYTCTTCGYEAYKMAKLSHCPLCVICRRCGKRVRKCSCMEGE